MERTSPACRAIGIDIGTANTCVAVYRDGGTEVIPDNGLPTMPSVVAFTATTRLIGAAAKSQAHANPSNTIFDALLFIGRDFADPEIQAYIKRYPCTVVESGGLPHFKVEYKGNTIHVTPAEVVSMILTRAKENAEAYLGCPVEKAVITIPTLFRTHERQLIRDIGLVAGLKVLYLLEGPVAAAVHYCQKLKGSGERNLLFYDLGAGSLDVALLTFEEGIYEVKAVHGARSLGGSHFDFRLLDYCLEVLMRGDDSADGILNNPRCLSRLGAACERAKRELTSQHSTLLEVASLRDGIDFRATITRRRLEELCQYLFRTTIEPIERVLRDAKMDKLSVHDVVMTGGSSRIPKLRQYMSWFFDGKEVSSSLNVDEAAACGASIQAAICSGNSESSPRLNNILVMDCTAFTLGVETLGGVMTPLIKRNSLRNTRVSGFIEIVAVEGTDPQVSIFEGEGALTKDNTYLSCVSLPLLRKPSSTERGRYEIEVTLYLDLQGQLEVSLAERQTGSRTSAPLVHLGRLSAEEIKRIQISASQFKADEDEEIRRILERDTLQSFADKIKDNFSSSKGVDHAADKLLTLIDTTIEWLDDHPSAETAEYRLKHNDLQRQLSLAETGTHKPATTHSMFSTFSRGRTKVQPSSFDTGEVLHDHIRSSSDGHRASQRQLSVPKHTEESVHHMNSLPGSPHRQTTTDGDASTPDGSRYATGNESAANDAGSSSKRPFNSTAPFETRLGPREFRLLHRVGKEPLAFTLRTHKIEYPPQYRALSYAWAAQEKDKTVLCYSQNGNVQSVVKITQTIEDALSELSQESMPIWVDAVCINQADHLEKNQQVMLMHRIYRRAHDVAIWLGKQQDDSALALDMLTWIAAPPTLGSEDMSLPRYPALQHHLEHAGTSLYLNHVQNLAAVLHRSKVVPTSRLDFRRLGLPDFDDDIWAALGSVLSPRWFLRLWTLQELLLARDSFVAFGSRNIPWRMYFDVGMQLSICNLLGHCLSHLPYSKEYQMRASTTFLRLAPFLNTDNSVVPFWQYLEEARHRDTTDPVDRIYGMLSLGNESLRSRIKVDYSEATKAQFWLVYMAAAKAMMATSSLQTVLTSINSVSKSSELPSWCPDFSQPCETRPFAANAQAGRRHAKSFVPHYNAKIVCIGGTRLCDVSHVASSSWSWPQDVNRVYGPRGIAAENLQWLDWCWSITQVTYQQDEFSAQRAFILTVLGETPPSDSPEDETIDMAWFNDKENEMTNLRLWLENLQVCAGPQDIEESSDVWHRHETMSRRLNDVWQNRRLCTTNNGRIGFGSHRVRPGDHVAIFFGESHVYFLRAQPAGVYEFISDGYVDGYMSGNFDESAFDNTAFRLI